jgi:hypothetical protein
MHASTVAPGLSSLSGIRASARIAGVGVARPCSAGRGRLAGIMAAGLDPVGSDQ